MRWFIWFAVVGLMTAVAAPAADAPSWQPVETVAEGAYFGSPKIVADSEGNALAVWEDGDGALHAAFRDGRSGRWGTPTRISPYGRRFALAASRRGLAVVVNHVGTARAADLQSHTWGPPRATGAAAADFVEPAVAVDDAGNATVVGQVGEGRTAHVVAVAGSLADGRWGRPSVLARGGAEEPQVALDATGGAIVTWTRCQEGRRFCDASGPMDSPGLRPYRIELRRRVGVRGRWQRTRSLGRVSLLHLLGTRSQRAVFADPDGRATVVWIDAATRVVASSLDHGSGRWTRPAVIAGPGLAFDAVAFPADGMLHSATNARRAALVWWIAPDSPAVGAAIRPRGAREWRLVPLPDVVTPPRISFWTQFNLALGDDGSAYLVASPDRVVGGARLATGVDWAVSNLADRGYEYGTVSAAGGSGALAAWSGRVGGKWVLRTARYPAR